MAEVGTLEDAARKRKDRLKSMRQKGPTSESENEPPEKRQAQENAEKLPKPIFRSYKPQDEKLQESVALPAKPADVETEVQDQLEAAAPQPVMDEVDLINLAPRKPDWDLKRDIAKKLEKLERRTQRAIAELIRERLQAGKEDLATAVNAGTAQMGADDDDDDED